MDPYRVLGVSRDATRKELIAAYREKSKKHHPDTGGDDWAFVEIQRAYEELLG